MAGLRPILSIRYRLRPGTPRVLASFSGATCPARDDRDIAVDMNGLTRVRSGYGCVRSWGSDG